MTSEADLSPNAAAALAVSKRIVGRVSSGLSNTVAVLWAPWPGAATAGCERRALLRHGLPLPGF